MPLPLGFLKKPTSNLCLTAVYDSYEIKTALIFYDEEGGMLPKVLSYASEKLPAGAVSSSRIIQVTPFITALSFCVQKVMAATAHKDVSNLYLGLSGESVLHTLTNAKIKRDASKKITQAELNEDFSKLFESASNNALENYISVSGNSQEELGDFLSSTVYIKLNGSICENPIDHTAESLELSSYIAFAAQSILTGVESAVKKSKLKLAGLGPVIFALTESLKPEMGSYFDSVLIYVNQDHTDIGVVFGGSLVEVKTLPLGEEAILNHLPLYVSGIEIALNEFVGIKTFANEFMILRQQTGQELIDSLYAVDWGKTIPLKTEATFKYITAEQLKAVAVPAGCPLDLAVLNVLKHL